MHKLSTNYETMFENATNKLAAYIVANKLQSLVLGVSGGIDSALVAAIAREAIHQSKTKIPLIGRSIAIESNQRGELVRARAIGKQFCTSFKELDLTNAYSDIIDELETAGEFDITDLEAKIALGNIKARMRMIQLYHLAGVNKGMVLSTDNYTELLLGFWTLHGDVGDYGMIQNLWKTEVYGLARWMCDMLDDVSFLEGSDALFACVEAVPTDGLGITDSDLDQLGASSYYEVDTILINHMNNRQKHDFSLASHPVVDRYERTHFKRDNPYNIPREELLP